MEAKINLNQVLQRHFMTILEVLTYSTLVLVGVIGWLGFIVERLQNHTLGLTRIPLIIQITKNKLNQCLTISKSMS